MSQQPFADHSIAPCSCAWVQARLFEFIDGTLQTADRARWQAHADACPQCQNELAAARRSETVLRQAVQTLPAAGDLRSGFYARLAESEAAQRPARRFSWALAVPALAAGMLAVVFLRPHTTLSTNTDRTPPAVAAIPPVTFKSKQPDGVRALADSLATVAAADRTPARSSEPKPERLVLTSVRLRKRLPTQDIRRSLKMVAALNETAANRTHWGMAFKQSDETRSDAFFAANAKKSDLRSGLPQDALQLGLESLASASAQDRREAFLLERDSAMTVQDFMDYSGAERRGEGNVHRVALADQTQDEGESYIEVEDETRDFRFSTRIASFQDSDEGIDISVSSDDDPVQAQDPSTK